MILLGLFDESDVAVEDIQVGYNVPAGTYEFEITGVELKEFESDHAKMPNQKAVIVELTVVDDSPQAGMTYDVFLRVPNKAEQTEKQLKTFSSIMKGNLIWFGVPESQLNTWDPETEADNIIGLRGLGTLKVSKTNSDYTNLTNFKLSEESGVSDLTVKADASATLGGSWA
jgi:hypothetical protein